MEKKEILSYLADHVNDCSSVLLSSPRVVTVKRSFVRHLENGRFVQTKSYKLKFRNEALEGDTPLSAFVNETNADDFYRYAFEFAEDFDCKLSDFCLHYPCRIQVVYEPDHITVEKLAGVYTPSNFSFSCHMRGTHSYVRFLEDLNSLLNKERDKITAYIDSCIFGSVARKFLGLKELMHLLSSEVVAADFAYHISKDGKSVEILCNEKYAYTISLDELTEFGSAPSLCDEIVAKISKGSEIIDLLEGYKVRLAATGSFELTYYQWLDEYRVVLTCKEIRSRGHNPISEFTINSENLDDLPKLIVEAQDELIKMAPKYGVYIERGGDGESK